MNHSLDTLSRVIGLTATWPTQIYIIADEFKREEPDFDSESFTKKAMEIWEDNYIPELFEDDIPF